LLSHYYKVQNTALQRLSEPTYDALGQMIQKKVGGIAKVNPLQNVDYQYNIRD
jgi:hypothetical protein